VQKKLMSVKGVKHDLSEADGQFGSGKIRLGNWLLGVELTMNCPNQDLASPECQVVDMIG